MKKSQYLYSSPLQDILLEADEIGLCRAEFISEQVRSDPSLLIGSLEENPILAQSVIWLDAYFRGENPQNKPPLNPEGTKFQKLVWHLLEEIPYGKTASYKDIAIEAAKARGLASMSNRAIGQAATRNPILILIPCHRLICTNGQIGGYRDGLKIKAALLKLEKAL